METLGKFNISIILLLLLNCTPYLLTNLNENYSQKYAEYLADLDPKKSLGILMSLHRFHIEKNDSAAIVALITNHREIFDLETTYEQATRYLDAGDLERARPFIKAIPPDKYSARYHNIMTSTFFYEKDYIRALEESRMTINLSFYNAKYYYNHANIFWTIHQPESSLVYLRHGYELDNDNLHILAGMAGIFLSRNEPDSTIYYGEKLVTLDTAGSIGYYFLARAYAMTGQNTAARQKYIEYYNRGKNDPYYGTRLRELKQLPALKE